MVRRLPRLKVQKQLCKWNNFQVGFSGDAHHDALSVGGSGAAVVSASDVVVERNKLSSLLPLRLDLALAAGSAFISVLLASFCLLVLVVVKL